MALSVEAAVACIRERTGRLDAVCVPVLEGLGRILAEPLLAGVDQPPFPRSPLDGYALRASDSAGASPETPVSLRVSAKVFAGDFWPGTVEEGTCVRLMTGAPIPKGADCVIRQEDTDEGETEVQIYQTLRAFENYCFQGEDFHAGEELLPALCRLDAAALAVAAAGGASMLSVVRRPRAAVISTGDELVLPGRPLPPGKIYNSNQAYLAGRLQALGAEVVLQEAVGDDMRALREALSRAVAESDVVFTTGGVSVGQKDLVPAALEKLGAEIVFHGVAMKPGMPTLFARLGGKHVLALSGNPFAAAVAFELLGRPLLAELDGDAAVAGERMQAVLENGFAKASPGRRFIRGCWRRGTVAIPEGHGNGQMRSMVGCNCLIDVPPGSGPLQKGDRVEILTL